MHPRIPICGSIRPSVHRSVRPYVIPSVGPSHFFLLSNHSLPLKRECWTKQREELPFYLRTRWFLANWSVKTRILKGKFGRKKKQIIHEIKWFAAWQCPLSKSISKPPTNRPTNEQTHPIMKSAIESKIIITLFFLIRTMFIRTLRLRLH